MMTVNEVSKLTGVSIRALQYYDKIGLLHPAEYTEAGYRLYDDTALERLQQIALKLAPQASNVQYVRERGYFEVTTTLKVSSQSLRRNGRPRMNR